MKKIDYPRKYICLRCGEIKTSKFFFRWNPGRIFEDKCENCNMNVPNGVCRYTPHMIIFNPNNKIKGHIL